MVTVPLPFFAVLCSVAVTATAPDTKHPDCFEVLSVTSARNIDHEVDLKGPFDSDITETDLSGPKLFGQAIGSEDEAYAEPRAYLNWYSIERPTDEPNRVLSVRDALHGTITYSITIGKPAMLLSPAQCLTTGSPSPVPDRLDYFKAYQIVHGSPEPQDVKLTGTLGPGSRRAVRAAYFCVPVEHWHHDEHSHVKNNKNCLVVYQLRSQAVEKSVTTLDQFGLNTLKITSSDWLCVPAQMIRAGSAASD